MKLSEKIYSLRRKNGLSQEQLAQRLDVSRQAISKWESGVSVPENDKLIALSKYFAVSVDYLIKEDIDTPDSPAQPSVENKTDVIVRYIGLGLCIIGFALLIVWGVIMVVDPNVSENIANSSVITIDGRGIVLTLCLVFVAIGVILLLKKQNRR